MGRGHLGTVDVGEGDQEAIPDADDDAPKIHDAPACGVDLDGHADCRQNARDPKPGTTTEKVGEGAGCDGREECAEGEKGSNELLESWLGRAGSALRPWRRPSGPSTYIDAIAASKPGIRVPEHGQEARHGLEASKDCRVKAILHVGNGHHGANQQAFPVGPKGCLRQVRDHRGDSEGFVSHCMRLARDPTSRGDFWCWETEIRPKLGVYLDGPKDAVITGQPVSET